jgi:hypothetical protein
VSTIEELLGRKSSCCVLENREYDRRDPERLALTSPTSSSPSIGIVPSRTQATEFSFIYIYTGVVGIATCYGLDTRQVEARVPEGSIVFTSPYRSDLVCGPPILLPIE